MTALREAADAVFPSTNLEAVGEDFIAAFDNKNPQIKAKTAGLISRVFCKWEDLRDDDVNDRADDDDDWSDDDDDWDHDNVGSDYHDWDDSNDDCECDDDLDDIDDDWWSRWWSSWYWWWLK